MYADGKGNFVDNWIQSARKVRSESSLQRAIEQCTRGQKLDEETLLKRLIKLAAGEAEEELCETD